MRLLLSDEVGRGWSRQVLNLARVITICWLPWFCLIAVCEIECFRCVAAAQPLSRVITLSDRKGVPSHRVRVLIWLGRGIVPRPLLVYEPGWNGSADENNVLLSELAAHGFDVIAIDLLTAQPAEFALTSARLRLPLDLSTSEMLNQSIAQADWRVNVLAEDATLSLSQIPQAATAVGIGALGYSFGGGVAAEVCRRDRRFLACVNMDGWQFGAAAGDPGPQPTMVLSGEPYPDRPRPAPRPAEMLDEWDAACLRMRMATIGGLFAQINGLQHTDFTDRAGGNAVVRALVAAFFLENLRHQPSPLLASNNPMPGVTLTRFAPATPQRLMRQDLHCVPP